MNEKSNSLILFNSVVHAEEEIEAIQRQLTTLKDMSTSITQNYSGMPSSNNYGSKIEFVAVRIVDLETKLSKKKENLMLLKVKAMETINSIQDTEQRIVLEARYLSGLPVTSIAESLSRSRRWVYNILHEAIIAADKIINN